jgi:hypothetical protein
VTSAFDQLASQAHRSLDRVFGSAVSIDDVEGTAIVTPQDDMMLGNTVQIEVRSAVTVGEIEYTVIEIDDVDSAGIRKARMAPA